MSGSFEIDGVAREESAEVPAEFVYRGRELSFSVRPVGSEQPISVTLVVSGVAQETGTASSGVQGSVRCGPFGIKYQHLAAVSVPEYVERADGKPPGPRPELIGMAVPDWTVTEWMNTEPLRLADLRGRVVLVRWFTGPI